LHRKTGRFAKTSLIKTQDAVAGTTPKPESQPPPLRFAREVGRLGEPSLPRISIHDDPRWLEFV